MIEQKVLAVADLRLSGITFLSRHFTGEQMRFSRIFGMLQLCYRIRNILNQTVWAIVLSSIILLYKGVGHPLRIWQTLSLVLGRSVAWACTRILAENPAGNTLITNRIHTV